MFALEVAAKLNVNEKTVYRLTQEVELRDLDVPRAWRFPPGDIEKWVVARKQLERGRS